ncbi:MAG: hypothetical protein ACYDHW_11230 [Syntrophorhabdaceae bacterium]
MTNLCEVCAKEIESVLCPQCKEKVLRLGPYCYMCGAQLTVEIIAESESAADDDNFADRILCSDGNCIGVLDEKGICKVCKKPYTPESE